MRTNKPDIGPSIEAGYEKSDVGLAGVNRVIVMFFVFLTASFIVGGGIWWFAYAKDGIPKSLGRAANLGVNTPPLQNSVTTKTDIMTLRRSETARLEGTGWSDPSRAKVHIPIEKAMDIVATGRFIETGKVLPALKPRNTTDQNPAGAR